VTRAAGRQYLSGSSTQVGKFQTLRVGLRLSKLWLRGLVRLAVVGAAAGLLPTVALAQGSYGSIPVTHGGAAPTGACDPQLQPTLSVPYIAVYYFYGAA